MSSYVFNGIIQSAKSVKSSGGGGLIYSPYGLKVSLGSVPQELL